jgi:hypothetical protein
MLSTNCGLLILTLAVSYLVCELTELWPPAGRILPYITRRKRLALIELSKEILTVLALIKLGRNLTPPSLKVERESRDPSCRGDYI